MTSRVGSDKQDLDTSDPSFWFRAGWVARGLSYIGAGLLAFSLATGMLGIHGEPSQKGAIELVGGLVFGRLILVVLAGGLVAFALWELTTVLQDKREAVLDWIDHGGKLIGVGFYALLAWSAVQSAFGTTSDSGSTVNRLSRFVLDYPLGRVAVAGAGVGIMVIAARRGRRIVTGDFGDSLVGSAMSSAHEATVETLGRFGEVGRALSFVILGSFLVVAGVYDDGDKAQGLDRSLYDLTDTSWGRVAVAIVGVGFAAYGAFCAASAPARRLPNDR